jgi:pimeloyl-ACP methyl ester carboxylesterase
MAKKKVRFLVIVLVVLAAVGSSLYYFQDKLIFHPTSLSADYRYQFDVEHTEHWIDTPDGARLNAIMFKADKPKGLVVYFHGNAGDLSKWGQLAGFFTAHNYDVLMWDYRGFGKSNGALSERALYNDAQLVYEKAKEFYPEGDIILYGRSIGSAPASYVANRNKPRKLILESPFYSLERLSKEKYPFLPVSSLLRYKLDNSWNVAKIGCRVIFIHGEEDRLIPMEHSVTLYKVTPEEFRTFVRVPGAGHNDLIQFEAYKLAIYKELL